MAGLPGEARPPLTEGAQAQGLLGPAAIRELAQQLDLRPTKTLGQNFLHDANTIRRIVRTADLPMAATLSLVLMTVVMAAYLLFQRTLRMDRV